MAGGTGGHVFPALAVAKQLQSSGWEIHWLGTKHGLEADIVPKVNSSISLHFVSIKGLRRTGKLSLLFAPFRLIKALYQSLQMLSKINPDVVLGMGGFVSGPGGLATWLQRRPLLIHEQNAIPGMTNQILAKLAHKVLEAFPGAFPSKIGAIYTGNPVREELLYFKRPKVRFQNRSGPLRLLILGGSRGARVLNEICPTAFQRLPERDRPIVWHQTGKNHDALTKSAYEAVGIAAHVGPFIDKMEEAYAWADLVICRSGAITISELASVGLGSILIPYPFAVDDHQTYNGQFLEKGEAAVLIPQSMLTPEKLANLILELSQNRSKVVTMAENAYALAKRDASQGVAAQCEEVQSEYVKSGK